MSVTLSQNLNNGLDGVNLSWSIASFSGVKEITLVYFKTDDTDSQLSSLDVSPSATSLNLELEQGEAYSLQLQVTNASSTIYSNVLSISAPFILSAPVITGYVGYDNSIEILLQDDTMDLTSADSVEFVLRKTSDNTVFWIVKPYSISNSYTLSSADDANLANYSTYRVASIFQPASSNTKYLSPSDISNTITAIPTNLPNQVQNVALVSTGVDDLELTGSWDLPADFADWSGSNYSVNLQLYRNNLAEEVSVTLNNDNRVSYVFENLTRGWSYKLNVIYTNTLGAGQVNTVMAEYVLPTSKPDAPILDSAVEGDLIVTLNWSAPSFTGQSAITSFKVYKDSVLLDTVASNILTYEVPALTNGIEYSFEITAVNAIGESVKSNALTATPFGDMLIISLSAVSKTVTAVIKPNGKSVESVLLIAIDNDPNDLVDGNFIYDVPLNEIDQSKTSNITVSHAFSQFSSSVNIAVVTAHTDSSSAYETLLPAP